MSILISSFRETFMSYGYKEEKSHPVFPSPDKTTLFTCATVSTFKDHILSGQLERLMVVQPCLRTQNLKRVLDKDFDPEYLSSFSMLGVLCPVDIFNPECIEAFFDSVSVEKENILVRTSSLIRDKIFLPIEKTYQTESDTRNKSYYVWKYGESFLSGMGITFSLRQINGDCLDIGNLVVIYKDGIPIAVEFGFGEETFLARQQSLGSPYKTSPEYLSLGLGYSPSEKRLGDSLILSNKLFSCGIRPGDGKSSSVLRKSLRSLCFLVIREYGVLSSHSKIISLAEKVSLDREWLRCVDKILLQVQESLVCFYREVNHISNHVTGLDLDRKIIEYKTRYNIPIDF